MKFTDRARAGRTLAGRLQHYAGQDDLVVLALPRGGVPVAFEIARELGAPLEVFLVRKLGVPNQEEFAMGAIAEGGVTVLSQNLLLELGIPQRAVSEVIAPTGRQPRCAGARPSASWWRFRWPRRRPASSCATRWTR